MMTCKNSYYPIIHIILINCLILLGACQQEEVAHLIPNDKSKVNQVLRSPNKVAYLIEHLSTPVSTEDATLMFEAFQKLTSEEYQEFERLRYEGQHVDQHSPIRKERYKFHLELNRLSNNLFKKTPLNLTTDQLRAVVTAIRPASTSVGLSETTARSQAERSCHPWAFDQQESLPVGDVIDSSFGSEFRWCSYEGFINPCNLAGQCSESCEILLHSGTYNGREFSPVVARPLTWGALAILYYSQNEKGLTHDQLIWYDSTSDYEATYSQLVISRYWLELVYGYFALEEVSQLLASHVIVELTER